MLWVPAGNVVCSDAVALANVVAVAGMLVTATGLPIAAPLSKKVTVPLGPAALLLCVETVAVKLTAVAVVTPVEGLAPTCVPVSAGVMVKFRVLASLGVKLLSPE
jgi:hypothetical protein